MSTPAPSSFSSIQFPKALDPYKFHLTSGAVALALGLASKKLLKVDIIQLKDARSGIMAYALVVAGSYLGEELLLKTKM